MVLAATKSGMSARAGLGLPPPIRDEFTLPDPHALATGSRLLATAPPIFPRPHVYRILSAVLLAEPEKKDFRIPFPYPTDQGRRKRRMNSMMPIDFFLDMKNGLLHEGCELRVGGV